VAAQVVFNRALTGVFVAGTPFVMVAEKVVLDFLATVTALAAIDWFLEFTGDDPNDAAAVWNQELAEEDAGGGVVAMPKVIRTFKENGGANLAIGTHSLSCQFVRTHKCCRIQARVNAVPAAGAASLQVLTQFGIPAISPG